MSKFDEPSFHTAPSRNSDKINETYRKWFVGATRAKSELIETGQYLVKKTMKDGTIKNTFLEKALELQGKEYLYSPAGYMQALAEEKEEEQVLA